MNKTNTKKHPTAAAKNAKAHKGNDSLIAIIAASVALIIIVGIVIVTVIATRKDDVDYLNDDLSAFVEISPEIYKNVEFDIPLLSYSDALLAREINKLLVKNKAKDPLYNGANITSVALTVGDVANIWYRGFFVNENGEEESLSSGSNFNDSSAHKLELGSGSFIAGIEEALLGVVPSGTPKFEKISKGAVSEEYVVYVSYEVYTADGLYKNVSYERIDLSDENLDRKYGNGFRTDVLSLNIGESSRKDIICRIAGDSVDTLYKNFKIEFATACEKNPIRVETSFPADYAEKTLRGKNVVFEIYVNSAVLYKVPEWNADFILNTLEVSEEELNEYEGEGNVQRYENKLKADLAESVEDSNNAIIEDALWSYYTEKAVIKKLPEDTVNEIYMQYFAEVSNAYEYYSSYYGSLDKFATTYYGLSEGSDWRAYINSLAETEVKEKLVFYYIVRAENLIPDDKEFEVLYNKNVNDMYEYYIEFYKSDIDACKTEEERNEKLASIKTDMMEYYGEEYFREAVYYQYALDGLLNFVTIKNQ